jgi:ring-1,2-phenylacetyl-CoA epoxidase subunit PaaD
MVGAAVSVAEVYASLAGIPDPEIPVISITDLGIVRDVAIDGESVVVTITPTYSGCPAMHAIEEDVGFRLRALGFAHVEVRTVLAPAWSTDWIAPEARERMREYGIVPPHAMRGADTHRIHLYSRSIACPRCMSENTERLSEFGSTACKAMYRCLDCREPFDYFKPL